MPYLRRKSKLSSVLLFVRVCLLKVGWVGLKFSHRLGRPWFFQTGWLANTRCQLDTFLSPPPFVPHTQHLRINPLKQQPFRLEGASWLDQPDKASAFSWLGNGILYWRRRGVELYQPRVSFVLILFDIFLFDICKICRNINEICLNCLNLIIRGAMSKKFKESQRNVLNVICIFSPARVYAEICTYKGKS